MSDLSLKGLGVLVTRPADQSVELIEAIESRGGHTLSIPVLEIVARPAADVERDQRELAAADLVIFVSANAVRYGLNAIETDKAQVAAIGPATAAAISRQGGRVNILPTGGSNSEHLLAMDELRDLSGKTVTIVRGQSGRELLADTLRHRGAHVQYLGVYERTARRFSDAELKALETRWQADEIGAIIIMSVASLDALLAALPADCIDRLPHTPLVAPGERVIQTALQRLPGAICVQAPGPGALELVEALMTVLHQDTDSCDD